MVAIPSLRQVHVEHVMGTVVSLDVRAATGAEHAVAAALAWLHDVDSRFSTYRPDSEISRLDRGELELAEASEDVRRVLERCAALRVETGGFFDAYAGGRLDPSALVKGWAAQGAADILSAGGLTDFCLSAGGDIVARGGALPERGWRIGIQHPRDRSAVAARVWTSGLAVATTGAYERGPHVIQRYRKAAPTGILSMTVTGPDLGSADAYSTAAFAMGANGCEWMLDTAGYEALAILADETMLWTPGFPLIEDARLRG
jgi:thiamine biosynthesis lipoprotein